MKELRQPKAGDIWLCGEGAVLVFGASGDWVDYLWQDTPDKFGFDGGMIKDWHKHFTYESNIFDCEELKDEMPQDYKEIKEQQQVFETMAQHKAINKSYDPVNHPSHYCSHPSGVECITITEHYNFCIGNALKYLWRAGLKEGNSNIQDLQKAVWYIQREIKRLDNERI